MKNLRFTALLLTLLLAALAAYGQSFRGTLRGEVKDASGAAIAGATVAARNTQTSWTRTTLTSADGIYVISELPSGSYEVTASGQGLQPVKLAAKVDVGAETPLTFTLGKVAQVQEQVEVQASGSLLEPAQDTLSQVIENKLVIDLPLNGRDFGKLVALTPGVAVEGSGVAGTEKGFGQFNINGNRDRSNNYLLDGTDNNDPFFNNSALNQVGITGAPASLLPIDAIEEFNLQTQAPAEYGRNSGATVNILTKSGGNQFHGSAFEYLRNSALDARNYFNTKPNVKSPFKNNQFGASLGGPIVHGRTFFFGAYEGQRERVTSDFLLGVPTTDQINAAVAQAGGSVNPALLKVLQYYPTATTVDSTTGNGTAQVAVPDKNDLNSVIVKIDHQLSPNELITGRYAYSGSNQRYPLGGTSYGGGSRLAPFAQLSPTRVQVVSASLLSTLSSNKLNELRFGYTRYRTSFRGADSNVDPATLGLDLGTGKFGLPEIDFNGDLENLGAAAYSVPRGRISQTFQWLDHFTWTLNRHVIKFGGEFRHISIDSYNDNLERGLLDVDTDGSVVDDLTAFFTGDIYASAYTGNTQRTTFNNGASLFVQDDYRVSSKLTANLGLRWEYFGPISEKNNLLSNLGTDGLLHMVGSGINSAWQRTWTNFSPRLGLAYQLYPTTVLHAGYGLYYDYIPQNVITTNYTNVAGLTTNPIGPKAVLPLSFDGSAWASGGTAAFSAVTSGPYDIFITPRKLPTPYTQSWNLNIQQSLNKTAVLEIGYVGSKGTHLARVYDVNQTDANGNFPDTNYLAMDTLATNAGSVYHALQTSLRVREWKGVTGFVNYTWSKSLDDASDAIEFTPGATLPQDSYNLRAERGPSTFDTRQRFTAAVNYAIPTIGFGPDKLKKGWQLGAIVTAQTGRPIPIEDSSDNSGRYNHYNQRPNLVPGINPILSNWSAATGYLNPAAFAQPDDGTFGNLGRNAIFGPKFVNTDFSVEKRTQLTEKIGTQLRAEFFNIFNHPNFALPGGSFGSSSFGQFSQTPDVAQGNPGLGGGGPRVLQLAVRVEF
ncbi:MAG: TonB-dependent receptor [Acidobacteriota bacterium]|nr:TonB-dependent receptor [Acidobacteriota bacterium]